MKRRILAVQYHALAELRHQIRLFLYGSDAAARQSNLEPQQYQVLLAIRGLGPGQEASIRTLAERLLLKHHSVVELIDRLEANKLVERSRSQEDHRKVLVALLPRGERLLEGIARQRLQELRSSGRAFVRALDALIEEKSRGRKPGKRPALKATSGGTKHSRP